MRRPWHNGGGGGCRAKTNKCYLSGATTDYKLLELQSVIWQMFKDAVNESFAFIFTLKHPNKGRKTLPGWLMLEDEGISIIRNVGSSLSVDMAKLASRLRNLNYFSQYLFSLLVINKIVCLFGRLSTDLTRNGCAFI
jgi:hypothetical protein